MDSQRFGTLRSWHEDRGFGVVQGSVSHLQRYFLHVTQILEGPVSPKVGDAVYFDVAPSRKPGGLPQAINAKVVGAGVNAGGVQ
jgi:cold shock CspA family protein